MPDARCQAWRLSDVIDATHYLITQCHHDQRMEEEEDGIPYSYRIYNITLLPNPYSFAPRGLRGIKFK